MGKKTKSAFRSVKPVLLSLSLNVRTPHAGRVSCCHSTHGLLKGIGKRRMAFLRGGSEEVQGRGGVWLVGANVRSEISSRFGGL